MARGKVADRTRVIERQAQALELRKQGKSYRAIGDRLGVSQMQAHRDIQDELKRLAALNLNSADELRQLELERLDRIIDGLDHWVQAGNAQAAMAILKAMDTRAKLLGLYAPEKIQEITWEDQAIADIKAGVIRYEDLVKAFDVDLATELFARAGVTVSVSEDTE